jgi:hypothetical protein
VIAKSIGLCALMNVNDDRGGGPLPFAESGTGRYHVATAPNATAPAAAAAAAVARRPLIVFILKLWY